MCGMILKESTGSKVRNTVQNNWYYTINQYLYAANIQKYVKANNVKKELFAARGGGAMMFSACPSEVNEIDK